MVKSTVSSMKLLVFTHCKTLYYNSDIHLYLFHWHSGPVINFKQATNFTHVLYLSVTYSVAYDVSRSDNETQIINRQNDIAVGVEQC